MLTVAYCRVSSQEQAAEGYSIDGQADKLRAYADLRELGDVMVISDPGLSGKDMHRPGLQQLLEMVERGHVGTVLIWRLDRLSRDLVDLATLAECFTERGVALHSFTENLDLSTAAGRMFYNILASFAQYYREHLSENVKMGLYHAAVKLGKWPNRPKMGYSRVDGTLVPNEDAPLIRQMFAMRAAGASYRKIQDATGVAYSTVNGILQSRCYLGETLYNGNWYPGEHDAILTEAEWEAAQRQRSKGLNRGKQLLGGRVRCGLCSRLAAVEYMTNGAAVFRCRHRGEGCQFPRRKADGLELAARLALRVLSENLPLQEAIREQLHAAATPGARRAQLPQDDSIAVLERKQRKLLDLFYADKITADLFAEEERRLTARLEAARLSALEDIADRREADDISKRFEEIVATLNDFDIDQVWDAASEKERRVLIDEMLDEIALFPDHLEVTVVGAPRMNVTLHEVGLCRSADCACERGDSNPHRL